MRTRTPLSAVCAIAALTAAAPAFSATFSQTTVPDFSGGVTAGSAVVMGDNATPPTGPQAGGVGIMPPLGASIISDDFNYTTVSAAQAAGWLFLKPNEADIPELLANPSEFLFSGDTSQTGATKPAPGFLRLHVSRPHDLEATSNAQKRQPVLAINNNTLTGDFIVEAKFNIPEDRKAGESRHFGIIVTHPSGLLNGKADGVNIDENSTYIAWGPSQLDTLNLMARIYTSGSGLINYQTTSFPGKDWYARLVKRGTYYYAYARQGDTGPWIFQTWFSAPQLAGTDFEPVVAGVFGKSWSTVSDVRTQYKDADFDSFKVNRVGTPLTGTYSHVLDAGAASNWQTFGFSTHSMQGLKYQLRSGNAASGGTLTDAGAFIGPDGTGNTWFEDDAAQVIPNATGKRYLEYKFNLDSTPVNLPAYLDSVRAVAEPQGVNASYASTRAEFGADAGGLAVQPGDGDLSLARTEIYRDDFNASEDIGTVFPWSPGASGWAFSDGMHFLDPSIEGSYTFTGGKFRMTVGAPQNLDQNDKNGGVLLLRDLPSGVNDFEIETTVDAEASQSRMAGLVVWMDVNNWVGVAVSRRNEGTFGVGIVENSLLGNTALNLSELNYGSNSIQMRITKKGQIYTFAVRDVASPSPSWRVVGVRNGSAPNPDFNPTQVGLMSKAWSVADRNPYNYDFDYFRIASVTDTGTKDITFNLPAAGRPDILRTLGDALSGANSRFQVSTGGGFVGPDGTAASFFSPNEPKLPAAISSPATVRVTLDSITNAGVPYLHALGVQYATGDTAIQRDTNAADFNAGTRKENVDTSATPGVVSNAGAYSFGNWVKDDLNFASNDLTGTAWTWDTAYLNPNQDPPTTYSVTANPGHVRLIIGPREDIGTGAHYHPFFRRTESLTGDWEIEALVQTPEGRDTGRITGIGVQQDNSHLILLGILNTGDIAQRSYNGGGIIRDGAAPAGSFTAPSYYLRIQKAGQIFTSWAKPAEDELGNPTNPDEDAGWVQVSRRTFDTITNPQVGFMAHSVNAGNPQWPVDYDYFRVRSLNTEGVLESRVLDMGTAGYTPLLTVQGTNTADIGLQFRAADTQAALSSLPFVGPDGTANTTYAGNYVGAVNGLTKRYVQYRVIIPVGSSVNDVALIAAPGVPGGSNPDVVTALKIAGGLQAATSADMARLDVVGGSSAGKIDLADAVKLLRGANGL